MSYCVYILHSTRFDKYYIGQTQNFELRFFQHNSGKVQSTAPFVPWEKVGLIRKDSRTEAMALEKKFKNLNRDRLLLFIQKYFN